MSVLSGGTRRERGRGGRRMGRRCLHVQHYVQQRHFVKIHSVYFYLCELCVSLIGDGL